MALVIACGDNLPRSDEDDSCDSLGVTCSGRGVCVEEPVVINRTGLGAGELFPDPELVPIKGR